MNIQSWISLTVSGLGLFLSSWIVIPAPTFTLLPLAVGAPEISPLLLVGNGIALGFALMQQGGLSTAIRVSQIAIGCSVCALILSSLPLLQLPETVQRADSQMQAVLGTHYLTRIPAEQHAQMRPHPVGLTDLVMGLSIPAIQPERQFFSTGDGTRLALALYRPPIAGSHPAIITIYGGAWRTGNPEQNAVFNRYMAAQGYTVIAINYRHAPQFRFPTQVQDVQAALQWVVQHASEYDVDLNRVALMGWSAGGHLALLAAYQTNLPIRAVVSYYGPTNLTAGYYDLPHPDPIDTRAVLEALMGGNPEQLPEQYLSASPVQHVRSGLPPTLLIYGQRDHLVKPVFGQQLYDQLQATDNTTVLISLPWSEHAFDAIFRGIGNQISLYHTERFLAWALYS